MSQFTKSLEKRIQELTESIDAQKTELTAYERVLHMELSKGSVPAETISDAEEAPSEASHPIPATKKKSAPAKAAPAVTADAPAKANKTSMVADVVKSFGTEGATPKDVDAYFTAKNIERSKNLVYNTLSYLVARNKLTRRDGKYFAEAGGSTPAKKKPGRKPGVATKTAATKKTTTKRRLSPEGLQRIKDALKKRWAAKRAAEESGAKPTTKSATKKK